MQFQELHMMCKGKLQEPLQGKGAWSMVSVIQGKTRA